MSAEWPKLARELGSGFVGLRKALRLLRRDSEGNLRNASRRASWGLKGEGYKDNACGWYAYPNPNTTGIDDLVNAVLARVDQEQLHSMSKGCTTCVTVCIYSLDWNLPCRLKIDTLRLLANLELEIDFDVYHDSVNA